MDDVLYILSSEFDYDRMICDDAGPGYARRMGWTPVRVNELSALPDRPHVFDNRLTDEEIDWLRARLRQSFRRPVFLKIVDPRWEAITERYYQALLSIVRHQQVQLLGPYHKAGLVGLMEEVAGRPLYHHLPYGYESSREQPLVHPRRRRVFLSGSLSPTIYPARWRIHILSRRHPLAWLFVRRLRHPGYPDVGMRQQHDTVGDRFLQAAARYRFMWVDGAAWSLELLRYCECAYAGCVPIGEPASTLPVAAAAEIRSLPIGREVPVLSREMLANANEISASASRYREAMRSNRDPLVLRRSFLEWWSMLADTPHSGAALSAVGTKVR